MAEQPMSYAQSASMGGGYLKKALQSTVGAHPVAAGVAMAGLVVLALVLGYYVNYWKGKCKGGFGVARVNNMTTGNNTPLWWHGSGDAGWGGSLHREATPWHVAHYEPRLRAGCDAPCCPGAPGASCQGRAGTGYHREGMHGGPPGPAGPPPGPDYPGGPDMSTCRSMWDPAADAEAQALATAGGINHDGVAERRLMGAVDAAFDTSVGLSDAQLQMAMHTGGAP